MIRHNASVATSNESTQGKANWTRIPLLLKSLFTAGLLILVFTRIDFGTAIDSWRRLSMGVFLVAGTMYCAAWAVASFKWKLLLPQCSWIELVKINLIGQFYSTILPGQITGEAVKVYRLAQGRPDAEQIAASVIIDRITGLLALFSVALGGALLGASSLDRRFLWVLITLTFFLLGALFSVNASWFRWLARKLTGRFGRLREQLGRLTGAWQQYLRQPGRLLWSVVLGVCFQLIAIAINVWFAQALDFNIEFAQWCWIFGMISLITMLPFTIAGLGLREGAFVGMLAIAGVAREKAIALSFAVFCLLLAGALVGAVLDWIRQGNKAG